VTCDSYAGDSCLSDAGRLGTTGGKTALPGQVPVDPSQRWSERRMLVPASGH